MTTLRSLILAAMGAIALPALAASTPDALPVLPLGDPARAFELVSGEAGQFLDLRGPAREDGRRDVALEDLARDWSKADVVLVGEHHANAPGHDTERRIVEALAATGRPLALGFEFFESQDDAALARYVAKETSLEDMLVAADWTGFSYRFYSPMLEIAREHGFPVLGLNVPRELTRKVSHEGFEALSDEQKALVGPLGTEDPKHRLAVDTMMGGMGAAMPAMFEGMLKGQMTWDAAMARSILRAREGVAKDRLVVVIVGVGHVAHGLGIPSRLRAADPALDVRVIVPVAAEKPDEDAQSHPGFEPKETATLSRGFGDAAYILPDTGGAEGRPRLGVTLAEAEGGVLFKSVEAGDVGARAGLREGDVLVAIDGMPTTDLPRTRLRLQDLSWSQRVELRVRRGEATLTIPMLCVPAPDGPGRWVESMPASQILDGFDPRSPRSLRPAPVHEGVPSARLVELEGKVVRLDILDGQRLAQTWFLDDDGRPAAGLLAQPAGDGAVRIELERDASGAVTRERRLDAAGSEIAP
jgi:uncharacterized iron-regulated protein